MKVDFKERRLELKLTQNEVAKRVGVAVFTYQKWEGGTGKPTPENLKKLKEVLQLD